MSHAQYSWLVYVVFFSIINLSQNMAKRIITNDTNDCDTSLMSDFVVPFACVCSLPHQRGFQVPTGCEHLIESVSNCSAVFVFVFVYPDVQYFSNVVVHGILGVNMSYIITGTSHGFRFSSPYLRMKLSVTVIQTPS